MAIRDVEEFLRNYLLVKREHYQSTKAPLFLSLFPIIKRRIRILEVGCGGGYYSLSAVRMGARDIMMIDVDPVCVKAAKLNLSRNVGLSVEGIMADATKLPLRSEVCDLVLCIDLIEHVEKDNILLLEVQQILKDEGLMLIATQNSFSMNYLLEGFVQRHVFKNVRWMGWDVAHL